MSIRDDLTVFFISMYNKNKLSLSFLLDADVPKIILNETYNVFLKENLFDPIEKLPEEENKKLVAECMKTGLEFSNETLINSTRILHTIKFINENS